MTGATRTDMAPFRVFRGFLLALAALASSGRLWAGIIDPFTASQVQFGPMIFNATNWAGYAVEGTPETNDSVTAVSGTWVVPTAMATSNSAANSANPQCATWVGIDGFGNSTVEQIGTASYLFGGIPEYYAWYELYPANMMEIGKLTLGKISPGDTMTASVQYGLPSYPNEFLLTITDNTTGKSYSTPQADATATRSTAEWIAEAPSTTSGVEPLPLIGSVPFTNASATIGGITGPIDDPSFQEWQVNLRDATWSDSMTPTAVVDSLSAPAVSSFTVVQVPEPSAIAILAAGVAMLAALRRSIRAWAESN
jgi:hypothetical protein